MKNRLIIIILSMFVFSSSSGHTCTIDITSTDMGSARNELLEKMSNPGLRVSYSGIKEANAKYGLGGVNNAMEAFEKSMCESIKNSEIKKIHPEFEFAIKKSDFKGYYVTCSPTPACLSFIESRLKVLSPPALQGETILETRFAQANNYSEGYLKARVRDSYPNYSDPIEKFIKKELDDALSKLNTKSSNFSHELSSGIDLYRKKGSNAVEPKLGRLIKVLDLLEIPFSNSNNIEDELVKAISYKGQPNAGKYSVVSAKTGDDLFIIVKEKNEVVKIIGGDARGLGTTNIVARYNMLSGHLRSGKSIESVNDILTISKNAIKEADALMDHSLTSYYRIMVDEISNNKGSLDDAIALAHKRYLDLENDTDELMHIRSGAIENCGKDQKIMMNRITTIHNDLKKLESIGVDGFFGMSCLATKYWLLKKGL